MNFEWLKPMLLSEEDKPFYSDDYLYEVKFDGIRALIYIKNNNIIIKSRNNTLLNDIFPELINIKYLVKKECILDGEIILMEKNKESFDKLKTRMNTKIPKKIEYYKENYPVTFICFDILYENKDLTNLPLIKRKEILNKYKDNDFFVKSRIFDDGIKLFKIIINKNLEGIVAKKKDSKYYPDKRTREWIKIKRLCESDYYICGYRELENVVSLILGEKINNKYTFVSKVILGKKREEYKQIKKCEKTKKYLTDFNEEEYIYIKPDLICSITYLEKTNNNHLRHPVFKEIKK